MRLIKMTGGLGNQMFIYAFYLKMHKAYPDTRIDLSDMMHYNVHNGYELHNVFPHLEAREFLIPQAAKKVIEFIFFRTILERKQNLETLEAFTCPRRWPLTYFKGFYQSERFFEGVEADVRRAFAFGQERASERTLAMSREISADAHAVSLHVRRGDYLQPSVWRNTGRVCSLSYYRDAIARMQTLVPQAHFYVFSDDPQWAQKHLPLPRATFITWNKGADSWQDMMLMSQCRHHIICNSTFSWWGAWLNPSPQKHVIAPQRWSALYPTPYINARGWTLIDSPFAPETPETPEA